MEPQIIDYYNDLPFGINVIEKMNEELSELQKEVNKQNSKLNKFKSPIIVVNSVEGYLDLEDKINNFIIKIKNSCDIFFLREYPENYYEHCCRNDHDPMCRGWRDWHYNKRFVDELINELNEITQGKNKEWCEFRIILAIETCLGKSDFKYLDEIKKVETIADTINNGESNNYLPSIYCDLDTDGGYSLGSLINYHCIKCGILANYFPNNLLCVDCE